MTSVIDFDVNAFREYASRKGVLRQGSRDLKIIKFSGGQSNFTYLVRCGDSSFVLRKQPSGALLSGAHQVDREAHIMDALGKASRSMIPLPRIFAIEADTSVIGTKFFVMEYVQGVIYRDTQCDVGS